MKMIATCKTKALSQYDIADKKEYEIRFHFYSNQSIDVIVEDPDNHQEQSLYYKSLNEFFNDWKNLSRKD